MRRTVVLVAGLVILAAANWSIYSREALLNHGRVVLLELVPVDPRSLMQGDYMALRFAVARNALPEAGRSATDGHLVLTLDDRGVGTFARLDNGAPLGEGEVRMRYRVRGGQVRFATNAFFFEEGSAALYETAKYGEFRVDEAGDALLTGLRNERLEPLGPSSGGN